MIPKTLCNQGTGTSDSQEGRVVTRKVKRVRLDAGYNVSKQGGVVVLIEIKFSGQEVIRIEPPLNFPNLDHDSFDWSRIARVRTFVRKCFVK